MVRRQPVPSSVARMFRTRRSMQRPPGIQGAFLFDPCSFFNLAAESARPCSVRPNGNGNPGYFRRAAFFAAGRVALAAVFFAAAFVPAAFFAPDWRDLPPKILSQPDENASVDPVCTV